ncbi:hypothetical protein HanPI659440_Chr12g0467161 [Helianthus annuus]|nr:hypothetical protein HanPI659440_Chr12g0467161 [Helianthus annuus]
MSALDYILLDDLSGVEIEQREIPEGGPSIVRRTEHVRTAGNLESVRLQPIMDGSSTKKLHAPVRMSTRGTASSIVVPQSSDPISIDSGDEDDASVVASVTRVKFMKKEVVPKASGVTTGTKLVHKEARSLRKFKDLVHLLLPTCFLHLIIPSLVLVVTAHYKRNPVKFTTQGTQSCN